jgi:methylenetetrahydrofolate--tRNA-(uracil-5-)-methyltransferase
MKPVGLVGRDGRRPWAVVQLRRESLSREHFNLVGFQSRMKWGEQQRVFRTIPGFANAEFLRLGQVHRNTFVNAPRSLDALYRVRREPRVRLAGQITGVEGYLESAATGLASALYLTLERRGRPFSPLPSTTAMGALARHLTESDSRRFQPANVNYGLFPPLPGRVSRGDRRAAFAARAAIDLKTWAAAHGFAVAANELVLRAG